MRYAESVRVAKRVIAREERWRVLSLPMLAIMAALACHRPAASMHPSPMTPWLPEQHCWWAAYRTTLAPESVATQFEAALASIGFADERRGSLGDTAWAEGGPTALEVPQPGVYAARVVAIRMGDSTHARIFVGVDSSTRVIPMCAELMRRAALRAVAPRQEEADDSTARWRRRR